MDQNHNDVNHNRVVAKEEEEQTENFVMCLKNDENLLKNQIVNFNRCFP